MQEDTDPDKLKPYKKDLEYLDDNFKVFRLTHVCMRTHPHAAHAHTHTQINHFYFSMFVV